MEQLTSKTTSGSNSITFIGGLFMLMLVVASMFTSCTNAQAELTTADYGINGEMVVTPIIIQQNVWSEDQMYDLDGYHESDDLLVNTHEYVVYLNQTSPTRDTVYIYHCVNQDDWQFN